MHVTLLYAEESRIDLASSRDRIALRHAGSRIYRSLAQYPLQEVSLYPEGESLESYGRRLAVPIRQTPFMQELRGNMEEIVREELDVSIPPEWSPHMSVITKTRNRIKTRDFVPPFPDVLHVTGHKIEHRIVDNAGKQERKLRFHNKPQSHVTK